MQPSIGSADDCADCSAIGKTHDSAGGIWLTHRVGSAKETQVSKRISAATTAPGKAFGIAMGSLGY